VSAETDPTAHRARKRRGRAGLFAELFAGRLWAQPVQRGRRWVRLRLEVPALDGKLTRENAAADRGDQARPQQPRALLRDQLCLGCALPLAHHPRIRAQDLLLPDRHIKAGAPSSRYHDLKCLVVAMHGQGDSATQARLQVLGRIAVPALIIEARQLAEPTPVGTDDD